MRNVKAKRKLKHETSLAKGRRIRLIAGNGIVIEGWVGDRFGFSRIPAQTSKTPGSASWNKEQRQLVAYK